MGEIAIPVEQFPEHPWMDRDVIYQKYVVEGKNLQTIADELGSSFGTIQRWMVRLGIPARQTRKPLTPSNPYNNREFLWQAHIVEHRSLVDIASEIRVYHGTVRDWMRELGIPIGNYHADRAKKHRKYWQNREWLEGNYTRLGRSLDSIAEEVGCERSSVSRTLKRLGILVRMGGTYERPIHPCNNHKWLWSAYVAEHKNATEIAGEIGVDGYTVSLWLQRHDIPIRTSLDLLGERTGTYWQNKEWLEGAYARHRRNTSALAREIGIESHSLAKHLERFGIKPRDMEEFLDSASFNLALWNSWSPDMAFVLGYAFADGCVSPRSLTMVSTDRQLLEVVARCVEFTGNIVDYGGRLTAGHKHQYAVILNDLRLPDILAKYNLVPRKSLIAEMPSDIPLDCIGSFVRGVFDGDGCARLQYIGKSRKSLHLIFVSASRKFVDGLCSAINLACGAIGCVRALDNKYNGIYHLEYINAADVIRVSALMYRNSDGKYLQRKRDKIDEFMQYLVDAITDTYRWNRYDPQAKQLILNMTSEWPTIDDPLELAA